MKISTPSRLVVFALLCVSLVFVSCVDGKPTDADPSATAGDAAATTARADSSEYGTLVDNFGIHTLSFKTPACRPDTIELLRSDVEGREATIEGDLNIGDRFVFVTTDGGESLVRAVNISQVERFLEHYDVWNARLVLPTPPTKDTIATLRFTPDSMIAVGKQRHVFLRRSK